MVIEVTRALTSVDINSGNNNSRNAALETNRQAMLELPRQLRLRGLGGVINIDFAPLAKSNRMSILRLLSETLHEDPVMTKILGWTPLGNLELNRKKDRITLDAWLI